MRLAQEIRNAYDSSDRDALERALARLPAEQVYLTDDHEALTFHSLTVSDQTYIDGVPQFNFSKPCSLMPGGDHLMSQCPRCNNPHHVCDRGVPQP